jgi:hypothetical protein
LLLGSAVHPFKSKFVLEYDATHAHAEQVRSASRGETNGSEVDRSNPCPDTLADFFRIFLVRARQKDTELVRPETLMNE